MGSRLILEKLDHVSVESRNNTRKGKRDQKRQRDERARGKADPEPHPHSSEPQGLDGPSPRISIAPERAGRKWIGAYSAERFGTTFVPFHS